MARKRDIKQFEAACRELGLTQEEEFAAGDALHAEKESSGDRRHRSYGELLAWLRQWKAEL